MLDCGKVFNGAIPRLSLWAVIECAVLTEHLKKPMDNLSGTLGGRGTM